MTKRAHLTWRLLALLALLIAAVWPRPHARRPAPVELTSATVNVASLDAAQR